MTEIFYIKQGDTAPALRATLKDPNGTAVDITGATVKFTLRSPAGVVVVNEAAVTIVTADAGIVEYAWQTGDTANVGYNSGEFEVTYSDGTIETFPNFGNFTVLISKQLA